jgi:hypothetical protein
VNDDRHMGEVCRAAYDRVVFVLVDMNQSGVGRTDPHREGGNGPQKREWAPPLKEMPDRVHEYRRSRVLKRRQQRSFPANRDDRIESAAGKQAGPGLEGS